MLKEAIDKLPIDLRMEVVLCDLIEQGVDVSEIVIEPIGLFKRRFSRDIDNVKKIETLADEEFFKITINREGIYDTLPQALFHAHSGDKSRIVKSKEQMKDEYLLRKKEERSARDFFLPYDNEFHMLRINLEREERRLLLAYQNNITHSRMLDSFWNLPKELSDTQKSILLYLYPVIHKITGDLEKTALCYSAICNVPVSIRKGQPKKSTFTGGNGMPFTLGSNSTIGTEVFTGNPVIEIEVGPLNENNIVNFIQNGSGRKVIEILHNYFIPVEADIETNFVFEEAKASLILDQSSHAGRLGYSSTLSNKKSK